MNGFKHAGMNLIFWFVGIFFYWIFSHFIPNDWVRLGFFFVFGSVIFDLDHLLYYGSTTKPPTVANIQARMTHDFQTNSPHFYIFHTVEFVLLWFLVIALFFQSGVIFNILIVIGVGWVFHLVEDIYDYLRYYRSPTPWMVYFSFISYIKMKKS